MKSLRDSISDLHSFIRPRLEKLETEEATKQVIITRFIHQVLGYDTFDPHDVIMEHTADVGMKKGEKVDYALIQNDKPVVLVEAKQHGIALDETHVSQLYRYYSSVHPDFAILTNGLSWMFFADLEKKHCMDTDPFMELTLDSISDLDLEVLSSFRKNHYDPKKVRELAKKSLGVGNPTKVRKAIQDTLWDASDELFQIIYDRLNPKKSGKRRPGLTAEDKRAIQDVIRTDFCYGEDQEQRGNPAKRKYNRMPELSLEQVYPALEEAVKHYKKIGEAYKDASRILGIGDVDPTGGNLRRWCTNNGISINKQRESGSLLIDKT